MKTPITITISRQFGTNGREIGRILAEELNIAYYNKEIMYQIAKDLNMDPSFFEEENKNDAGFYAISNRNFALANMTELSLNAQLYNKSSEFIQSIAKKESSVIIGRCSDYILKDMKNVIRVFCYCDLETRIKVAINEYGLKGRKVKKFVETQDQRRAGFYEFYTNQKWGESSNYDLMINTAHVSCKEAVEMIKTIYLIKKESGNECSL